MNQVVVEHGYKDGYGVILAAAKLLGQSFEPGLAVNGILSLLADRLRLLRGRVILPNKNNKLYIRYCFGLTEEERLRGVCDIDKGITGKVMKGGQIALVHDVTKEPLFLVQGTNITNLCVTYIAVPIVQDEIPVGVLAAHPENKSSRNFNNADIEILKILACMIGQVLKINGLMKLKTEAIEKEYQQINNLSQAPESAYGIIGSSPALTKAVARAQRAAVSDAAVMLIGESGVGKERFARLIHFESERRDQPFVCVNCAAIPENLLESELFGHEKGSFTGATSMRKGKFESANYGTLFLDEIGDMDVDLQSKLLRVLQEQVVQRVGSNDEIIINTRIICATNQNLIDAVNNGTFRMDLFYRLNVIKISLPSLRERMEDIPLFTSYFLSRANQRYRKNISLTPRAFAQLKKFDWPGNVRQLENFIERLVIMAEDYLIKLSDIKILIEDDAGINISIKNQKTGFPSEAAHFDDLDVRPYMRVKQEDHQLVTNALRQAGGNKTRAAKLLGMSPRQLHYRLIKLSIGH